jgi:hypothetical protein
MFHVMWMICTSLEGIKVANVSSIELDNLVGGGLYCRSPDPFRGS